MALYFVSYDLHKAGQNYTCISEKLEEMGTHWHFQQSVWLVKWGGNPYDLANHLETCLDSNDKLFVCRVSHDAAWSGYPDDATTWISSNM